MKVALVFFLCLTSAFAQTQEQIAARAGLEQQLNAQVPLDAVFRDEHGKAVQLGSFFGRKPVILALAYYECPNLCTLVLNGVLQTAQDLKFDAGRDYEIVVVSFDSRERPALAAAKKQIYIKRYGRAGTADGWHFLTGDDAQIARLSQSIGYRFAYDPQTRQFAHPSAIMVLTPAGTAPWDRINCTDACTEVPAEITSSTISTLPRSGAPTTTPPSPWSFASLRL